MNARLRKIQAAIAYVGTPKKVYARYCGVSRPFFSMYLNGDKRMPAEVEERLMTRLRAELQAVLAEEEPAALQRGAAR